VLQRLGLPHLQRVRRVTEPGYAAEVEILANERFAAVGGALLAALAESGLSARRAANVLSWFVVAQLALGPWRSRGEVRPAALAERMGVSRWTEWRIRRDAAAAGVIRDWTLPDPESRGYGRGAVRVVELAFVRTRAVTRRVAEFKEERASRAERRRAERARVKAFPGPSTSPAPPAGRAGGTVSDVAVRPLNRDELHSPVAGQLWTMLQRARARELPVGPDPPGRSG
jgi:hypothetical protein